MKILHINGFESMDYMNDLVFHGGREVFGENYIDATCAKYMYKSSLIHKPSYYGKGFSIACKLNDIEIDRENLSEKISDRYFDYIIYGSVFRNRDYLELVRKAYPKDKIVFIDGEDHQQIFWELVDCGVYFKRELATSDPNIHPINFSIPKECFSVSKKKERIYGTVDPRHGYTYIFDNERDYYDDYKKSYFGITTKKAGWDCMRHQEIVANYCFPYFLNLADCPERTMTLFPKKLVVDYMSKFNDEISDTYWDVLQEISSHALKYLTTEHTIKYILERL